MPNYCGSFQDVTDLIGTSPFGKLFVQVGDIVPCPKIECADDRTLIEKVIFRRDIILSTYSNIFSKSYLIFVTPFGKYVKISTFVIRWWSVPDVCRRVPVVPNITRDLMKFENN